MRISLIGSPGISYIVPSSLLMKLKNQLPAIIFLISEYLHPVVMGCLQRSYGVFYDFDNYSIPFHL